jgi:hypothetical protein
MSTPPQDPAGGTPAPRFDDPTRDIRLPSLPDRPPAPVRPEWKAHAQPTPAEQPGLGGGDDATAVVSAARSAEPAPPRPYVLPNEPTDKVSSPPQMRQQTLAFDASVAPAPAHSAGIPAPGLASPQSSAPPSLHPPAHGRPSYGPPGGSAPDRKRRWPWVVLTVLPILVIIAAGLLLLFLLRGA